MTSWERLVSSGRARRDVELASMTTYKLGGPADLFVVVDTIDTLQEVGEALRSEPMPVLVLGRGSNLLIADKGFRGVVVRLGNDFAGVEIDRDGIVEAGGSASLPRVARGISAEGRGGLEWGVGIPGSVGGAVRQNAGCFGREVVDVLVEARVVSLAEGTDQWVEASALDLGYRHSSIAATDVVVAARFHTVTVDPEVAAGEMRRITRWRKEHQPGGTLNAGSVFKNPPGDAAGAIIDRLGLKGFALGPVRVSPRHANFIEAEAGASAESVRRLIEAVQKRVQEQTGLRLEPEIQFVGFEDGD
ncbi:MAG TPA: UDP-N-acetylmuramate dehydrogenase [Acidimicrobiia bacterium]|nr:UDP-N-acetylmuramate dehydrogenase [Acidimicrobiia bacterium]